MLRNCILRSMWRRGNLSELPHIGRDLSNFLDAEGKILGDNGKRISRPRSNGAIVGSRRRDSLRTVTAIAERIILDYASLSPTRAQALRHSLRTSQPHSYNSYLTNIYTTNLKGHALWVNSDSWTMTRNVNSSPRSHDRLLIGVMGSTVFYI